MRKLAIVFAALLLLVVVIGADGCGMEQVTSTPTLTPTATPMTKENALSRIRDEVSDSYMPSGSSEVGWIAEYEADKSEWWAAGCYEISNGIRFIVGAKATPKSVWSDVKMPDEMFEWAIEKATEEDWLDEEAAQRAIALVRADEDMSKAAAPYEAELGWFAEYQNGGKWWVLGRFESPWGVEFVADATIWRGQVYTYIDYHMRPDREWVSAKAEEFGYESLYTRITEKDAIDLIKKTSDVRYTVRGYKGIGWVGELREDEATGVEWWFCGYFEKDDGTRFVVAVSDAREGLYWPSEYGFGESPNGHTEIPLMMGDWVRGKVEENRWQNVTNLPGSSVVLPNISLSSGQQHWP